MRTPATLPKDREPERVFSAFRQGVLCGHLRFWMDLCKARPSSVPFGKESYADMSTIMTDNEKAASSVPFGKESYADNKAVQSYALELLSSVPFGKESYADNDPADERRAPCPAVFSAFRQGVLCGRR